MEHIKRAQYMFVLIIMAIATLSVLYVSNATAATLTHTSLLETGGVSNATPMIAATAQQLTLAFTAASTAAGTIVIDFGTAWTGASGNTASTPTSSTTGCQALTGATNVVPGTLSPTQLNAHALQITGATSMTSGQSYCVNLSNASSSAVLNPSAGSYTVSVAVGTDSTNVSLDILSSGANAYSITGTVAPTFTMSLSSTTDTFGANLTSGSVTLSSGITATINTNAATGWFVWAADSQAGLHSTTAATTIPTVATGGNRTMNSGATGPGNAAYGLGISTLNTANYAYGGGTTGGGLATATYNEIATSASPASNATFVAHELANISSTTPPATDYTDTLTFIGAGSF